MCLFKSEKRQNCHWQLQNDDKMLANTTVDLENESLKKILYFIKNSNFPLFSCVFHSRVHQKFRQQVNVVS